MKKLKLTEETKKNIEDTVGLSFDQIISLPMSEISKYIQNRIGKKSTIRNFFGWRTKNDR